MMYSAIETMTIIMTMVMKADHHVKIDPKRTSRGLWLVCS